MACFGCKLAHQEVESSIVYEDEWVTALLDIAPFNEGHVLILPKKHYRYMDELDLETAAALMKATQKISAVIRTCYDPDGVITYQNAGAFDELTHFHLHVVPK